MAEKSKAAEMFDRAITAYPKISESTADKMTGLPAILGVIVFVFVVQGLILTFS